MRMASQKQNSFGWEHAYISKRSINGFQSEAKKINAWNKNVQDLTDIRIEITSNIHIGRETACGVRQLILRSAGEVMADREGSMLKQSLVLGC